MQEDAMKNIFNSTGHYLKIPDVTKGKGAYIFDEKGKKYLDLESGVWCTSIGHNNKQVNKTIRKQLKKITHSGFCHNSRIVDSAAAEVLDITEMKDGKCVFLCSGSEAIEYLRQISKVIFKRQKTLVLHDAYLGSYSSLNERKDNWHIFNWKACEECKDKEDCRKECEKLKNIPSDITEFIFEPGSSSGFVKFPPKKLIRNITDTVKSNNGLVLANEVTTGIGRTGKWFGFQHYGIKPDMISIGKGIGNGYPVSVAVLSKKMAKNENLKNFKYMQSHQNDPMGAAIAKKVIKIIKKKGLIDSSEKNGQYLLNILTKLTDNKKITAIRGRGLMIAIEFSSKKLCDNTYNKLIEKNFITCNRSGFLRIDPPLNIKMKDLNRFIKELKKIIN